MSLAHKPAAYKPTDELYLRRCGSRMAMRLRSNVSIASEVREVVAVVNGWRKHYAECGVTRGDIDLYAEQIDRPFLLDQRQEFTA